MKLTFEELIEEIREIANEDVKKMNDWCIRTLSEDIDTPTNICHDDQYKHLRLHHILDAIRGAAIAEDLERN